MKRIVLPLLFLAFTLNAQQKRTLTPEDLVDIRSVDDANVSPDGKRIAFVVTETGDPSKPDKARDDNIWIVPSMAVSLRDSLHFLLRAKILRAGRRTAVGWR
jgi:hypothetical protein